MKKVLSILISLCILFTLAIPAFADLVPAGEKHILRYSVSGAIQHLVTYTDIETALSDAKSGDIIEFFDDVTFDKQVTIPAGLDLTFVSGTKTEAYTGEHGYITIGNTAKFGSGSFVSYDENAETRTITSTYKEGSAIVLGEGATLNLKNIAIVGAADNTATKGGIVYVGGGAALNTSNGVVLSGGALGNEGTKGGAIYAAETAKLNIADTTFSGNNAAEGKDIYAVTESYTKIADGVEADVAYGEGQGVLRGDADGNGVINDQDAIYTLFSFFYSDQYPSNQNYDFDGNGSFNDQDAIYLLFFYFYPDKYPLK
ncbi:MAG: hypothetical protein IJJ40_05920 [Clostridia bacterium]|nr:hypothetical protein [Clostridia bacterium]